MLKRESAALTLPLFPTDARSLSDLKPNSEATSHTELSHTKLWRVAET